nr:MAG TPA: hypothetical protein [Caudoviricetes sp.]DAM61687.1 MAG TPA: hypothetical protein [Caudoviricetes sp.]DAS02513.1 MAG TPA: hypothetical protein [Caudoviricetes sp.]DAY08492.1 MAG TPA: hypothetical protein [Caudoviricetes sp.]
MFFKKSLVLFPLFYWRLAGGSVLYLPLYALICTSKQLMLL